ncbi:fungal-specific transcription factor domain-containing protein [Stachybotrys elegans]|uniref:Fungal-specific transcription factor domain-containing protein n=1 Tax=Stachybotrys elegans TaxID=80388 RepID=A0A8K0SDS0_9HYPO|nr:fungal-specific transcription factor domain-containing protein [Stachybotrys elegans]
MPLSINSFGRAAPVLQNRGIESHMMDNYEPFAASQPPMHSYLDPAYSPQNVARFGAPTVKPCINHDGPRYPVLEPVIPYLGDIITIDLACDLIDYYFSLSSRAWMDLMSPYILGFVFRKRAFLHPIKPRQCQPALLASMLWVATQASDAPFIASAPSTRDTVCRRLQELIVDLLKPPTHMNSGEVSPAMGPITDGVFLGGLGVTPPRSTGVKALTGEIDAAGNLDDVATCMLLAMVNCDSKDNSEGLSWWKTAWSLAHTLELHRELGSSRPESSKMEGNAKDEHGLCHSHPSFVTEEVREERRRIGWLMYMVDRHIAFRYDSPLFSRNNEYDDLYQPMDDTAWQNGEFGHGHAARDTDPNMLESLPEGPKEQVKRISGLSFRYTGHSIFGYLLPLMAILGEIIDLDREIHHPSSSIFFCFTDYLNQTTAEISTHLNSYEESLKAFEKQSGARCHEETSDRDLRDANELGVDAKAPLDDDMQTRLTLAYGTHLMSILHILLDTPSSPTFDCAKAISRSIFTTKALATISEVDPHLEHMPSFYSAYLAIGFYPTGEEGDFVG